MWDRGGGARRAEEATVFDGLDEGVVAAIAVVGFGDGVEVEEFEHEVAVEGEQERFGVLAGKGEAGAWTALWLLSPALTRRRRSSRVRWTRNGKAVRMVAMAVVMVVRFAGVSAALTWLCCIGGVDDDSS